MRTIFSLCLALAATLAMFQLAAQQSNTKDKQKQDKQVSDEDKPLYTKPVGAKGNTKASKESATLAFSGIDPATGKPTQARMGESASSADTEQVKKMFDRVPKREVLMAFIKEGGLIAR
jgi:ABC-type oligopeptide transport system substrate-binding subunit